MPQDNTIIKSILDPTIKIDELVYGDMDEGTGEVNEKTWKTFGTLGTHYPLIQINSYVFRHQEIMKMEIDSTEFFPKIRVKLEMNVSGSFLSNSIPKDGDLLSLFVNPKHKTFTSLRNDYLITSVNVIGSSSEGLNGFLSIEGTLWIPNIFNQPKIAIKDTSFNALKTIAQSLGMGFATNETETDDEMTWISGVFTYEEFIKHIATYAWKDENSFYRVFIDIYYHLNFVEVNRQFTEETEVLKGVIQNITLQTSLNDDNREAGDEMDAIFTNHRSLNTSNFYFMEYNPINRSSEISNKYGYTFENVFFEQNTLREWVLPMDPLITPGSEENLIILRGRPKEDFYKTQIKKQWQGIQYTNDDHNVHKNFTVAKIQNIINNKNTEKINVKIKVNRINFNVNKYGRFPFIFFIQQSIPRQMQEQGIEDYAEMPHDFAVDGFYTGWYLLKGFKITFTRDDPDEMNKFKQELVVSRREWPVPAAQRELETT